jgi:hypothetical protein
MHIERIDRVIFKTTRCCLNLRERANQMSDAHFCVFWAEKNAERRAQSAQELNFREARKEFGFDAPPLGAVTLCSGGEDVRAFPGKTREGTDTWYAQYRQVSAKGVLWRMINGVNNQPICYVGATEALDAAKLASNGGRVACR